MMNDDQRKTQQWCWSLAFTLAAVLGGLCLHFGAGKRNVFTRATQQHLLTEGSNLALLIFFFSLGRSGKRCDTLFLTCFWGGVLFFGSAIHAGNLYLYCRRRFDFSSLIVYVYTLQEKVCVDSFACC
jgi:hypothetical protein